MLRPDFTHGIKNLPYEELEAAGKRVAETPDDEIFSVELKELEKAKVLPHGLEP